MWKSIKFTMKIKFLNGFNLRTGILTGLLAVSLVSCIVVKHDDVVDDVAPAVTLSPKPEIKMSENLVRSLQGDMISFIPKGWFFVDVEEKVSPDVIAVAVSPEYNLSAVFTGIKKNDNINATVEKEGLLGLARVSFSQRAAKTAGSVKTAGKYQTMDIGNLKFAKYEFTASGSAMSAKAVVFISSVGDYYEFALIPMTAAGKPMPAPEDFDKVFRSIITTIRY